MNIWKSILILAPFFLCFFLAALRISGAISARYELARILKKSVQSADEAGLIRAVSKEQERTRRLSFAERMNARMNLFGISRKFETILAGLLIIGVVCAILMKMIFRAGPFLMVYVAGVIVFIGCQFINSSLARRKEDLTVEFLEKLRDLTSYLSAGKSVPVALNEVTEAGVISPVLYRELGIVRGDISLGKPMSAAFMDMYQRLAIPEVKIFAQTLSVYEEQGGNLIAIMQSSDHFFSQKLAVKNEQRVIVSDMQNSQKFMIGIPLAFVVVLAIINPAFYGDFYGTAVGQVVGIAAISMLLFGVYASRRAAEV